MNKTTLTIQVRIKHIIYSVIVKGLKPKLTRNICKRMLHECNVWYEVYISELVILSFYLFMRL